MTREEIIDEIKETNKGIHIYDEILFKIRSWWSAISTAIAVAQIGFLLGFAKQSSTSSQLPYYFESLTFLIIVLVAHCFWITDALNKSLQLVQIHLARDLEQCQVFNINTYSFTKSRRYESRSGRHWRGLFSVLWEESVYIFYIIPIFFLGLVLYFAHITRSNNVSLFNTQWQFMLAISIIMISLIFDRVRRSFPDFVVDILAPFSQRAFKTQIRRRFSKRDIGILEPMVRVRGFQFNRIVGTSIVVFTDYTRTWKSGSFIIERARVARDLRLSSIMIDVGRNIVYGLDNSTDGPKTFCFSDIDCLQIYLKKLQSASVGRIELCER